MSGQSPQLSFGMAMYQILKSADLLLNLIYVAVFRANKYLVLALYTSSYIHFILSSKVRKNNRKSSTHLYSTNRLDDVHAAHVVFNFE